MTELQRCVDTQNTLLVAVAVMIVVVIVQSIMALLLNRKYRRIVRERERIDRVIEECRRNQKSGSSLMRDLLFKAELGALIDDSSGVEVPRD